MLRLGDKRSDSREVLVDRPALADDDVVLSSTPEVADVAVTSLPVTTVEEESGDRPTVDTTVTEPRVANTTSANQPAKSAMNNNRVEVTDITATPQPAVRTTANVVRITEGKFISTSVICRVISV